MGIYIKDMEMPKSGRLTLQISADGAVYVVDRCNIQGETYTTNAIPVLPHGRLIDADALKESIHSTDTDERKILSTRDLHHALIGWINNRPTIIEAEEGEI